MKLPGFSFRPRIVDAMRGYRREDFSADLSAGVTVGVVALPLAMAFGIASGVKPEAGIFTAIIAGFLIAALGGSKVQIGGPAGAFVALLYAIVERYGVANLLIATATTPSTSTAIVPGTRAIQRRQRAWFGRYDFGHITTIASDTTPSHSAAQLTVCRCDHSVPSCEKKFDGIFGIDSPRKSFSCCSPMITAMPLVKPVTIDTGM